MSGYYVSLDQLARTMRASGMTRSDRPLLKLENYSGTNITIPIIYGIYLQNLVSPHQISSSYVQLYSFSQDNVDDSFSFYDLMNE